MTFEEWWETRTIRDLCSNKEIWEAAVKAERERCVDILERLHERSGERHNYYLCAAVHIRESE